MSLDRHGQHAYTGGMTVPKQKPRRPHSRAIRVAQSKHVPGEPLAPLLSERLQSLVVPAAYAQLSYYRQLGLRERLLSLPVMVAVVIGLIWQQIGSASELLRVLTQEGMLWVGPLRVSQQALAKRLLNFPAELFERVLLEILPDAQSRWLKRQRPLPPEVAWAQQHFGRVLIFDGSTLDGLLRKLKALRNLPHAPLAGRLGALLELGSRLPVRLWYDSDAQGNDYRFLNRLLAALQSQDLIVFDMGLRHYVFFQQLTERQVTFVTRPASTCVWRVTQVLQHTGTLQDQIVHVGSKKTSQCAQPLRVVSWLHQGQWYDYLTNCLDPAILPADRLVALYRRRWRIEVAFLLVKRLLGLAYLWVGSENGIQLQLWATWLVYACLIDLTDAVAEELNVLFEALSVEMVFRGLYHYNQACQRSQADDPIRYLAEHAQALAIRKRIRNPTAQFVAPLPP